MQRKNNYYVALRLIFKCRAGNARMRNWDDQHKLHLHWIETFSFRSQTRSASVFTSQIVRVLMHSPFTRVPAAHRLPFIRANVIKLLARRSTPVGDREQMQRARVHMLQCIWSVSTANIVHYFIASNSGGNVKPTVCVQGQAATRPTVRRQREQILSIIA